MPEVEIAQVAGELQQLRPNGRMSDPAGDGYDDETVTLSPPRRPPPVVSVLLNPRLDVVVVSFEVVLGEQAVGQPVLSSFHTPEQARLFRTEPAVEGSSHLVSVRAAAKQNFMARLHIR